MKKVLLVGLLAVLVLVPVGMVGWTVAHPPYEPKLLGRPLPPPAPAQGQTDDILRSYLNPGRDAYAKPEAVMDIMGLRPGMAAADIGCGSGYYTFKLARRVGSQGQVFATDVDPNAIRFMLKRMQEERMPNVTLVYVEPDKSYLEPASLDAALLVQVHAFARPFEPYWSHSYTGIQHFYDSLRQALKPGGRLAVIEARIENNTEYGPQVDGAQMAAEVESGGFTLDSTHDDLLPRDHFFIFRPLAAMGPPLSLDSLRRLSDRPAPRK